MKCTKEYMHLYAVTDRAWLGDKTLAQAVEEAIQGGATMVQLREKNLSEEDFLEVAYQVKAVCQKYQIPFLINDNVTVAKECDADGVHVGQDDMSPQEVRRILGKDKIIGVSAQTVAQALEAQANGADYLGVGAVFNTNTKLDAVEVPYDILKDICEVVQIPVCAIGGIKAENVHLLKDSGIDGIAVVSAIFAKEDIIAATRSLRSLVEEIIV